MLVNANLNLFPDGFPILAGEYDDFTIEWYRVVGSTIILTLFLNVFTPHITNFMFNFIRMCKRCCDRGCHCDKSHTKQILQEDYEGIYIGPDFLLEFRYSSLLTNIFVVVSMRVATGGLGAPPPLLQQLEPSANFLGKMVLSESTLALKPLKFSKHIDRNITKTFFGRFC